MIRHLRARPRLTAAMFTGIVVAFVLPATIALVTRCLIGWNLAVWLYLTLLAIMIRRSDHASLRRLATAEAEGASTVAVIIVLAAFVSLAGVVIELSAAKVPGTSYALPHLLFALATVMGSWLLVPVVFALTYASEYYHVSAGQALRFPDGDNKFKPHYGDFLYFSFTIAVASQTADISIVTPRMRQLVLMQSIFSFAFNTAILAFTINIAASMF